MNNKKWMFLIFSLIIGLTTTLLFTGEVISSNAKPKLSGQFDQDRDKRVVFSVDEGDTEALYLKESGYEARKITEAEEGTRLRSPVFMGNGKIAYIQTNANVIEEFQAENITESMLIEVDPNSREQRELLRVTGDITELEVGQETSELYLIASAAISEPDRDSEDPPNQYDLYSFDEKTSDLKKRTELATYSIGSLVLNEEESKAFVLMADDYSDSSVDSMFEATDRVYEISLSEEEKISVITDQKEEIMLADVMWLSDEQLIYQAVTNLEDDGNFIYDLMYFSTESQEEGAHLGLKETVLQPTVRKDGRSILYMKEESAFMGTQVIGLFEYNLESGKERTVNLIR
ncbi:hypothetical protein [Alkalicoccobacillus murimartini]|uniref:Uncharacterized protein n=1 Tax=Alkalicoccobacillus murimartini TaxID=171685 RepID=A0ABT9YLK8_9BACI|nr:hypothetical protein [Alkalicoccobacillus murimartini]MDQ0207914.1 hypothetical protein [Alkalicoccobacillus murimartini]